MEDKKLKEMQTTEIWLVKLHKEVMTLSGPFTLQSKNLWFWSAGAIGSDVMRKRPASLK